MRLQIFEKLRVHRRYALEDRHVLLREPDGGATSDETLVPGALRDRDGAQSYEQALKDARTRRGTGGEVLVGGDESVRAGDVLTLDDVPGTSDPLRRLA